MTKKLSRRDFLKLASVVPPAYFLPFSISGEGKSDHPNFIVLVFDAWSAKNISLYGYPRHTTPNLERLAEKAIVYHNHYAGGYFTLPGTASLLTSTLEWQHHVNLRNTIIAPSLKGNNLFSAFPEYNRWAYTHNTLTNDILGQMAKSIDRLKIFRSYISGLAPCKGYSIMITIFHQLVGFETQTSVKMALQILCFYPGSSQ